MIIKILSIVVFVFSLPSCQHSGVENKDGKVSGSDTPKVKYIRPKTNLSKEAKLNIPYRTLNISKSITNFAFGSCNDQTMNQPLWKLIIAKNPSLFLAMGDNVYASKKESKPIIDQYIKLHENSDYLNARETIPFMATWDDHDFGQNDGGMDNPEKLEAKKVFMNYWSYIKNIVPKEQNGIYHSRIVGEKKQRVQFIMLDTRFDRSPLVKYEPPAVTSSADATPITEVRLYQPNSDPEAKILSNEQWKWLENELKKPSELKIIVSSIQFLADDHGFEKWGNIPLEKKKMIDLLEKNKIKNVIFLSGDRHLASIAKLKTKHFDLYDITSSALNKPSRFTSPEKDQLYTSESFLGINFGFAEIDWSKKSVEIQIIGEDNQTHLSQVVKF